MRALMMVVAGCGEPDKNGGTTDTTETTTEQLVAKIKELGDDDDVNGILLTTNKEKPGFR